jgi:hypothetical protein
MFRIIPINYLIRTVTLVIITNKYLSFCNAWDPVTLQMAAYYTFTQKIYMSLTGIEGQGMFIVYLDTGSSRTITEFKCCATVPALHQGVNPARNTSAAGRKYDLQGITDSAQQFSCTALPPGSS